MARLQHGFAAPEDADGIARLFAESTRGCAMPPFALDRPADIFRIMEVRGTEWKLIVARDTERDGRLAAYGSIAYRPCYVNGRVRALPHLPEIFLSPEYRNGLLLARSYAFMKAQAMGEDFAQTQVCIGNDVALKAFTSRRGGMPAYLPYGRHAFITLPLGDAPGMGRAGAAARRVEVRRAKAGDIPALNAFFAEWGPAKQFYPAYAFESLGTGYYRDLCIGDFFLGFRHGRLAGVTGVWDQGGFKSTHYIDAAGPDGAEGSAPADPKPLFLHAMLTEENDPAVMAALIDGIRAAYADSPFGFLALGLDAEDPLRYGIEHVPQRVSLTHHFLVTFGKDPRPDLRPGPYYLESARC
jgi:hypothetical protein